MTITELKEKLRTGVVRVLMMRKTVKYRAFEDQDDANGHLVIRRVDWLRGGLTYQFNEDGELPDDHESLREWLEDAVYCGMERS